MGAVLDTFSSRNSCETDRRGLFTCSNSQVNANLTKRDSLYERCAERMSTSLKPQQTLQIKSHKMLQVSEKRRLPQQNRISIESLQNRIPSKNLNITSVDLEAAPTTPYRERHRQTISAYSEPTLQESRYPMEYSARDDNIGCLDTNKLLYRTSKTENGLKDYCASLTHFPNRSRGYGNYASHFVDDSRWNNKLSSKPSSFHSINCNPKSKNVQFEVQESESNIFKDNMRTDWTQVIARLREREAELKEKDTLIHNLQCLLERQNQLLRRLANCPLSEVHVSQKRFIQDCNVYNNPNMSPVTHKSSLKKISYQNQVKLEGKRISRDETESFISSKTAQYDDTRKQGPDKKTIAARPEMSRRSSTRVGLRNAQKITTNHPPDYRSTTRSKRYAISGESSKYVLPTSSQISQLPKFEKSER